MRTITLNKGGTQERKVAIEDIVIPDLWHVAKRCINKATCDEEDHDLILEVWHLAHALKGALTPLKPSLSPTGIRNAAKRAAWRYAHEQLSVSDVIDMKPPSNGVVSYEEYAYFLLNVVAGLPDDNELEFRKELAKRIKAACPSKA